MIEEKRIMHSCGGVVVRIANNGPQLLLVRQTKKKNSYGIPKGHTKPGESFEQCAVREVFEETGIRVELGEELPVVSTSYTNGTKHVHSFMCRVIGAEEPTFSGAADEIDHAAWFDVDDLPRIHMYQQPLIEHVKNMLKK